MLVLGWCSVYFYTSSSENDRKMKNQRTNGPVNAHLIYGPTVSTKTSFANFDSLKMGQGQLRVIIYINFVELENILLHAKFHDHRTISSEGEDF